MEIRTFLVDSSYLLKRSLGGAKDVATDKFGMIGGLYQFFTTTRKFVERHKINKVVLVWDGENSGFYRYKIDKAYKANRPNKSWYNKITLNEAELRREQEKELSILKQRKRIQSYAEELFFRQIEIDKIEADDIIVKYCQKYSNTEEIYVYTNDRDLLQTLNYNVTVILGNKEDTPITKQNFMFNFNYHYSNCSTIKTICGDVSDNIAGIKGMGEETLLKYFPDLKFRHVTVNEIYKESKKINEERVKNKKKPLKVFETLINNKERLIINNKLVHLDEPLINDEVLEEFELLDLPLSDEDRNSKNLYNLMMEDDFLSIYNSNFVNYIKPFYPIIIQEKEKLKQYNKDNSK